MIRDGKIIQDDHRDQAVPAQRRSTLRERNAAVCWTTGSSVVDRLVSSKFRHRKVTGRTQKWVSYATPRLSGELLKQASANTHDYTASPPSSTKISQCSQHA